MPKRTDISSILVIAAADWGTALAAQPRPEPAAPVIASAATTEELREAARLAPFSARWAEEVRERRGLVRAECTIASSGRGRSWCGFRTDGIQLSLSKLGRGRATPEVVLLSLGNDYDDGGGRYRVTGGAWIRDNDFFEIEAGGRVYTFLCGALGRPEWGVARCLPIGDLRHVAARLSFPRGRYSAGIGFSAAAGRAFADGTVRMLHNGRPVDLGALIAAARDFEHQDFAALVEAR